MQTVDIGELSIIVASRAAPEELRGVEALVAAFGDDFSIVERGARDQRGENMGFDLGDVSSVSTAIVALSSGVVFWLGKHVVTAVDEAVASRVKGLVAGLLVGRKRERTRHVSLPAPLTKSQLAAVRQLVAEQAPKLGVNGAQAGLIADAVVGALTLWPEAPRDSG